MCNLAKIFFIVVLFYISTTTGSSELSGTTWQNTSWNVFNPKVHYFKRHVSENIFTGAKSHVVAFASWDDYRIEYPMSYNLTVITHIFNGQTFTNICNLNVSLNEGDTHTEQLHGILILKENRILLTWQISSSKGETWVSQVVFVDTCQRSDFIPMGKDVAPWVSRYKNTFDLVFHNKEICSNDGYCILSFNYDGEPIRSKSTTLAIFTKKGGHSLLISSAHTMNYNSGEGIVLVGNRHARKSLGNNFIKLSEDIYTPILGWTKAPKLNPSFSWYSNSSGFASLCWRIDYLEDLYCQRLDGSGGKIAFKYDMNIRSATIVKIHNKPNGHILLLSEQFKNIIIDEAYENGKCKRLEIFNDIYPTDKVVLSIINDNQYCLSIVTREVTSVDYQDKPKVKYGFITKCARMSDLSNQKYISCADTYSKYIHNI